MVVQKGLLPLPTSVRQYVLGVHIGGNPDKAGSSRHSRYREKVKISAFVPDLDDYRYAQNNIDGRIHHRHK
jgi:hypothetical protein